MLRDERIAELTAEAMRDAVCAGGSEYVESAIRTAVREATEEAAKVCRELGDKSSADHEAGGCYACEDAIRARIEVPRNPR